MTYNPAIPQSTDIISASQSQIQTNFSQADTAFAIDHTAFSTLANQGKHKKSTYIEWANPPQPTNDPVTAANEVAVYSKEDPQTTTSLYLRQENNGNIVRMTAGNQNANSGANTAKSVNNGQTFFPGAFLMKFGTSVENATSRTVIFTTDANLSAFNSIYSVFLYPLGTSQTVALTNLSNTQFSISSANSAVTIYWIAIGI